MMQEMPPGFVREMGLQDATLARVLFNRGYDTEGKIYDFLFGETYDGGSWRQLHGHRQAVGELTAKIRARRPIGILIQPGVQGIAAAALMAETLDSIGGLTALRSSDILGHGRKGIKALEELKSSGAHLVVVAGDYRLADEYSEHASRLGLQIIAVYGHLVYGLPVDWGACITSTHDVYLQRRSVSVEVYRARKLSATAVAYELSLALVESIRKRRNGELSIDTEALLDLVVLGTAPDLLALDSSESRDLAQRGLGALNRGRRMGFAALARHAGEPTGVPADIDTCRRLGDHINALCWSGKAEECARLLKADHMIAAERLAEYAQSTASQWHNRVYEMLALACGRARDALATDSGLIIERVNDNEPELAAAIAEAVSSKFGLPAIVLTMHENKYHGFCESIPECDLYAALLECNELTDISRLHSLKFHVTVEPALVSEFQERLQLAVQRYTFQEVLHSCTEIDAEVPAEHLTLGLHSRLQLLEPYGSENRRPVFLTNGLRALEDSRAQDEEGLRHFQVDTGSGLIEAVMDSARELPGELAERFDAVYQLHTYFSQGKYCLEMHILDLRESLALREEKTLLESSDAETK